MNEIIVSLDNIGKEQAISLAQKLSGKVWGFKVNDLLIEYGCGIVYELKKYGCVFVDSKLYDTPNMVATVVKKLVFAGADIISCHVSGGVQMLQAAMEEAKNARIVGVTMLPSMSFDNIRQTYRGYPLERFAETIKDSKIHGVVCVGKEVDFWSLFDLIKVVPEFLFGSKVSANYLVIGKYITNTADPIAAVDEIRTIYANAS